MLQTCPRCTRSACAITGNTNSYTHWNCDGCHAGPFLDAVARLHCTLCSLDVCTECHEKMSSASSSLPTSGVVASDCSPAFYCPSGHIAVVLQRTTDWNCNVCKNVFLLGQKSMHCVSCDYDCCEACFTLLSELRCPQSHPLVCEWNPSAWRCDVCGGSSGPAKQALSYRCRTCDYDLCHACAPSALMMLKRQSPLHVVPTTTPDPHLPPWGDGVKRTVLVNSIEHAECTAAFAPTLPPHAQVISILRVENSALYRWCSQFRQQTAKENNGDANVVLAMHGTRGKRACDVALDDKGVDMRFSSAGCMFGRASYFSYDTAYVTRTYAHQLDSSTGTVEFLVCEVARGKVEKMSPSSNITRPSPGFHSIEGNVSSNVTAVMCYELYQAYPKYIVTCTVGQSAAGGLKFVQAPTPSSVSYGGSATAPSAFVFSGGGAPSPSAPVPGWSASAPSGGGAPAPSAPAPSGGGAPAPSAPAPSGGGASAPFGGSGPNPQSSSQGPFCGGSWKAPPSF